MKTDKKSIPLFWWSETRLMGKQKENYGDILSKYLVEKISGSPVRWVNPQKPRWYRLRSSHYLGVGSILHHATKNSIVWGSGIIDRKHKIATADFRAVRGPLTRRFLRDSGLECPEIYGDPALLLPLYFNPKIEKKIVYGLVPHYADFSKLNNIFRNHPGIRVIDLMTEDVEQTTIEILECENIISTSLHGGIVAQAYGIPAVFTKADSKLFGDGVKYKDYMKAVDIEPYTLPKLEPESNFNLFFKKNTSGISDKRLKDIQNNLLKACPFK